MAVKVGNKYLCNIPEAVSQLIEDVKALKDQTAGTEANVYKLIAGQAFDKDLFNKMKSGDIAIVNNLPFVVIKLENKIEGYYVIGFGAAIIYGQLAKIEWERDDILKFNVEAKYVKNLSFTETDIKAKSLETTGAIIGKTVAQSEVNDDFTITRIITLPEGLELDIYYEKAIVINGLLYFIFNYAIRNTTSSPIQLPNNWLANYIDVGSYGSRIYRRDGQSIDKPRSSTDKDNYICPLYAKYGQYNFTPGDMGAYLSESIQNVIVAFWASVGNIPANTEYIINARTFIALF